MNKEFTKKYLPYLIAGIVFILFTIIYCAPLLDGKIIQQGDTVSWKGMYQEAKIYNDKGDYTFWTGSMFSGMPTYQIGGGKIPSGILAKPLLITNFFFTGVLGVILCYLIGFFILLRAFKVNAWVSIFGAMAIALSSYFFIIIEAGHMTKAMGIGMLAAVIGGFYLIFNRKYIVGAIIVMLFGARGLMPHPQMTYYIFMLIGVLFIAELFIHIKEKRFKDLIISTSIFAFAMLVSIGTGFTKMQLNREYVKETMRGGHSELKSENNTDSLNKTAGLDLDYATTWSYGIAETATLLVPNFMGGSSNFDVGQDSEIYKAMVKNGLSKKNAAEYVKSMPTFWGQKPFTSGPVYVGAIIMFLFFLGLIIVKGPYKWALLIATLFSVLLAWGKHFLPFTELFFNYFPMYNKFRAVESILIVAEITIPLLAFLAIKAIMNKEVSKEKIIIGTYISAGILGTFCLVFALFGGSLFSFTSPNDAQLVDIYPDWLMNAIVAERALMLRSDALRSLIFILLGAGILWLFVKQKIKQALFIPIMGVFIVADLWAVDKRFFNDDSFVERKKYDNHFKKQPWEEMLAKDNDPNFRILNLTANTFNDSRSSYYFKSVGGYHAAKLRRYQDIIEHHISKNNRSVLDMLNTKYFIVKTQEGQVMPQKNPNAMGNAWFIDSLVVVNSPNEECDALNNINLRNTAVVDASKFGEFTNHFIPHHDETAVIEFLTYKPNHLTYKYSAAEPATIVFSEIYYPYGWHAYIDDQPVDHFRANYVLRALNVPAGEHKIRFEFKPDTLAKSEPIAYTSYAIMYGTILFGIGFSIWNRRKEKRA